MERRNTGRVATALVALALAALLAGLVPTATAQADPPPAPARASANPLAGPWGVYTGSADGIYPAWQAATGEEKRLLGAIAQRPRVRWFGQWIATSLIADRIREYVRTTQDGNPDVVVQLAVFRLWPRGEGAKDEPLTEADLQAYRAWVDEAARGIGTARVAMVLEPDLAVALKGWRPKVRFALTRYAARVFGALPNTTVYLDASDADWLPVDKAVAMLRRSGVAYVRGFALGATHYNGVRPNVRYARAVSRALAAAGLPGKRAVIDTADNGRAFTWLQFYAAHPRGDFDNAPTCATRTERRCVTLGIPPTWRVADALPAKLKPVATEYVDGYLWFGRPWLVRQAAPFSLERSLRVARTTPYTFVS